MFLFLQLFYFDIFVYANFRSSKFDEFGAALNLVELLISQTIPREGFINDQDLVMITPLVKFY